MRLLRRLLPLFAVAAVASPAHTGAWDVAISGLISNGPGLPPYTAIVPKTPTKNGAASEYVPSSTPGGMGVIQIDPAAIAAGYPSIDADEAVLPGVLYTFMVHEALHGWRYHGGQTSQTLCDEVEIQAETASHLCYFINAIIDAGGSPGVLCELYNDFRESFNNGLEGGAMPGGATTAWAKDNCPGPPPDDMGACTRPDGMGPGSVDVCPN